jgi:hypothetical protein
MLNCYRDDDFTRRPEDRTMTMLARRSGPGARAAGGLRPRQVAAAALAAAVALAILAATVAPLVLWSAVPIL